MKGKISDIIICPELGYVIGVLLGDGCTYKRQGYHQVLYTKDREFAEKFSKDIKKVITTSGEFPVMMKEGKYYHVDGGSKALHLLLTKKKHVALMLATELFPVEFLRGIFDSEGSIYVPIKYNTSASIELWNSDKELIDLVKSTLEKLGFEPKVQYNAKKTKNGYSHRIRLFGWKNAIRFYELIGFTILRKHIKLKEVVENIRRKQQELSTLDKLPFWAYRLHYDF